MGAERIVINRCFGGFCFSDEGYEWLIAEKKWTVTTWNDEGEYTDPDAQIVEMSELSFKHYGLVANDSAPKFRTNPDVIEMIEKLGKRASDSVVSDIQIVEVPDDIDWVIDEYDGKERIREIHK